MSQIGFTVRAKRFFESMKPNQTRATSLMKQKPLKLGSKPCRYLVTSKCPSSGIVLLDFVCLGKRLPHFGTTFVTHQAMICLSFLSKIHTLLRGTTKRLLSLLNVRLESQLLEDRVILGTPSSTRILEMKKHRPGRCSREGRYQGRRGRRTIAREPCPGMLSIQMRPP